MRAVRTIDGEFGVVRADLSDDDADGVVVDVVAAGICGSDLHMRTLGIQVTFGHEFSGRLGDGTAVAVQPLVYCGACDRCEAGQSHICRESGGTMYGIARDGGMADQVRVDPSCLVSLPDGLSVADACLVEPLAVAQHACNGVDVEAGQRVLVIGGGMIGLASVAVALAAGADVDLSARHRNQVEAGERLGAGTAASGEYDVVMEAAGTASAVAMAIDSVRPGGVVSIPALHWEGLAIPNGLQLTMKEVRLQYAFTYGHHHGEREVDQAAALLAVTPELADAVVTHRFGLDDAPEAFRVAADRAAGAIKVVLEP